MEDYHFFKIPDYVTDDISPWSVVIDHNKVVVSKYVMAGSKSSTLYTSQPSKVIYKFSYLGKNYPKDYAKILAFFEMYGVITSIDLASSLGPSLDITVVGGE